MSSKIRTNLSGIVAATNKRISIPNQRPNIGKVYGVVTTENTPTKKQFEKVGGFSGIGTVFYLDYEQSKNVTGENTDSFFDRCKIAKPFHSNIQDYPLIGETILIQSGPSPENQISNNSSQKYYIGVVNLWNNPQQNSPSTGNLGKTFTESPDVRNLMYFEGDRIYQGRKGNSIRFGSTVKREASMNEWSSGPGKDGDPIMILANGHVTTDIMGPTINVEEINKEKSSIYMTSSQKLPLIPGVLIQNPFRSPLPPNKYSSPQIILNSDRVTINAKKDEVLIYSKSDIELSTDEHILLNAGKAIHLHISGNPESRVLLGTGPNGEVPFEPVLLGGQTHDLLLEMYRILSTLAGFLSSVVVPTTEGGILVSGCISS